MTSATILDSDSTPKTMPRQIYGTFFLGTDEFAIEMSDLQEVINAPSSVQKMPLAPPYLLGLFNLRGCVLPVIDLSVLLESPARQTDEANRTRMVVLRRGAACIGLLFDAVGEILRVASDELARLEQHNPSPGVQRMPVSAVICRDQGKRILQVLDLGALLAVRNLPQIEQLAGTSEASSNLSVRMRDLYREKLIGFTVGACDLAIEMKSIVSIVKNHDQKPSPCKTGICETIIYLHGRIVPVVQMSRLLNIPATQEPGHIMICRVGREHVGFEVDQINSIIPYARNKVMPIPVLDEHRSSVFHGCFTDRDGKDYIVLNEQGALSKEEIVSISATHAQFSAEHQEKKVDAAGPQVSLLTFRLGKLYGLRLLDVLEVLPAPRDLARAPDTPPAVLGVLNLRGTPISVVDPRQLLDLGPEVSSSGSNLLVFQHESRRIAMRVDSVESILSVTMVEKEPMPQIFFREDHARLQETFDRGMQVASDGEKAYVLVLSADQVVRKLAEAMAA